MEIVPTIDDMAGQLVGLPLSIARRAADMRIFHFGPIVPRPDRRGRMGTVGTFALHIQCPWRLVSPERLITGWSDHREAPGPDVERDEDRVGGTLQDACLGELLRGYDAATRSYVNATDGLIVGAAAVDRWGGLDIVFEADLRLQVWPDGADENWRFIVPDGPHWVISGGKVRADG